MTPPDPLEQEARRRQKSRALVFGLILGGLALLIYAITIAKLSIAW